MNITGMMKYRTAQPICLRKRASVWNAIKATFEGAHDVEIGALDSGLTMNGFVAHNVSVKVDGTTYDVALTTRDGGNAQVTDVVNAKFN